MSESLSCSKSDSAHVQFGRIMNQERLCRVHATAVQHVMEIHPEQQM